MKRVTTLKPPRRSVAKVDDRDNPPWTEAMLGPAIIRHGRGPQKAPTKVLTTMRLDADVLAYFRAQGPGYQTRINDTLREALTRIRTARRGRARAR